MSYIYETHLHTKEASACSKTYGKDYIDFMLSKGYSGIIVTDHFFNGNSSIPYYLPWKDKVEQYCRGYENALEAASGTELTVLFGIEFNFSGDEYLIYGPDKKWLLENPDIMKKSRHEVYELVHESGGIMIHAHPYRERDYLSEIHLTPSISDGAEVYNAGNPDWQNALGYDYAVKQKLLMSAGSDIHYTTLTDMGGLSFSYELKTIEDFVKGFKNGDGTPVVKRNVQSKDSEFIPVEENLSLTEITKEPTLEVYWH